MMSPQSLRTLQQPLKDRYKQDPRAAFLTLSARVELSPCSVSCRLDSPPGPLSAGLHPLAGGDGTEACSAEMLLQAVAACAGVTLSAVATALDLPVSGGTLRAEGDLDFRGTLGVDRETPVGLLAVRLIASLATTATDDQLARLAQLTERYCVVVQSLKGPVMLSIERA